jgi:hypothetical protein
MGFITFHNFDLVQAEPVTHLSGNIQKGQNIEKSIRICKKKDTPINITYELVNGDSILLARKSSFGEAGCKVYTISQPLPTTALPGTHHMEITISYKIFFREILIKIHGGNFEVI